MSTWIALIALLGSGALILAKKDVADVLGFELHIVAAAVAGVAFLIILLNAIGGGKGRLGRALHDGVTFAAVTFALIAVYSYRDQLAPAVQRVASELLPQAPVPEIVGPEGKDVRIKKQWGGHFVARAQVNGAPISMIVDTGASTVVLKSEDARKSGIDPSKLTYSVPVQTANGISFSARVRLESVTVGGLTLRNVDALVAPSGALHQSLLGMSFLSRLRSYEFSGDFLTLRS